MLRSEESIRVSLHPSRSATMPTVPRLASRHPLSRAVQLTPCD